MLTAEEMNQRIDKREADVLREKMYPEVETTTASIIADMAERIAEQEAYLKTQDRLRDVRGF